MEGEEGKMSMSRKERRKAMKKMKRKQIRKEAAERERLEEEARLNDPDEQRRIQLIEQQEAQRMERNRILFEEKEKALMDIVIHKHQQQQQQQEQQCNNNNNEDDVVDHDDHEYKYVEEEGPPEIIWQGNEIIFKKKKVRVTHTQNPNSNHHQDNTPTSNPLPPESQSESHNHVLHDVAQQIPNFGTEQDKACCPFHLKIGACRFGLRCSRVHFYPDKSSTILIKNMYNGPGLACDRDQDEGLEGLRLPQQDIKNVDAYTDEEVDRCFEEFYEDVHTEFLKFGEIVNFKVCKNGSFHLRGNVYVQYKSMDSALLAFNSLNGRYFAGKQVSCQFVNLRRWKVAICGEYMKSGFKTCSHGTACNFIHCFRNPGGDYEWADSDKPPPNHWVKKMVALFGYSDDYETFREQGNLSLSRTDSDRYHSRRSKSREMDQLNCGHSGRRKQENERRQSTTPDEDRNANFKSKHKRKSRGRTPDGDSDVEWLEIEENRERHHEHTRNSSFNRNRDDKSRSHEEESDVDWDTRDNAKQHGREERNSRKWIRYEAVSDGHTDEKRHHVNKSKTSRHQSGDISESDKDSLGRREMETRDYSRKSSRHRRSSLEDDYEHHENENDKADGGLSRRGYKREHRHKKKKSKY